MQVTCSFLFSWALLSSSSLTLTHGLSLSSRPSLTSLHANPAAASAGATTTKKKAVVVGAGPVGIATALTLASRHNYDVSLLEASPATSSQEKYDPTKAFLYNVNLRGQELTTQFPSMQRKLEERGVPSGGVGGIKFTIVPADPNVPIPKLDDSDAKNKNKKKGKEKGRDEIKGSEEKSYWLPRHEMVQLMLECLDEHEEERVKSSSGAEMGRIDYCPGQECISVRPDDKESSSCVVVTTKDASTGKESTYEATLVVGADGMNSRVRECLATTNAADFAKWSSFNPKRFVPRKWTSPSSYQRIKVLQLPPRFQIPDGEGGQLTTQSDQIYAIRSIYNSPRKYLSLGLLPMKNNDAVRPTNIVTRPDHEIWKLKDGESVRKWFEEAYPRLPFHKDGGMISDEEWDRFAKAEGTRFPACQYSPGMGTCDDEGNCGVVLVGDAIHAFPPDIGQGVNAGLADVVALDRALDGKDTITGKEITTSDGEAQTFKANIERYQKQHEPEIASLIRLARFGSPYQYKQPHRIDRLRRNLWTANVIFRLLLNKLTFGLVPTQCIMLSQKPELTFRQVMRRADLTTAAIMTILLGAAGLLLKLRFSFLPVLGM